MTEQLEAPQRLFGLPHRMPRDFVDATVADLRRRFEIQYARPVGEVVQDLQEMREAVFDPVAREERLRRQLDGVRERLSFEPAIDLPESLALPIGDGARMITPEGRVAIPVLAQSTGSGEAEAVVVDEWEIAAAEHLLASTYGVWVRYRLDRVLRLRSGDERAMLPVAIATVLFLLVNGNIGEDAALIQPKLVEDQELLDEAVTLPIAAFVDKISAKRKRQDERHFRLYNGYGLSEARRRLGDAIALERTPESPADKRVYVAEDARERVIEALAQNLKARDLGPDEVANAFDALTHAYEARRPQIAAYGVTNARPSRTRELRKALLGQL